MSTQSQPQGTETDDMEFTPDKYSAAVHFFKPSVFFEGNEPKTVHDIHSQLSKQNARAFTDEGLQAFVRYISNNYDLTQFERTAMCKCIALVNHGKELYAVHLFGGDGKHFYIAKYPAKGSFAQESDILRFVALVEDA